MDTSHRTVKDWVNNFRSNQGEISAPDRLKLKTMLEHRKKGYNYFRLDIDKDKIFGSSDNFTWFRIS